MFIDKQQFESLEISTEQKLLSVETFTDYKKSLETRMKSIEEKLGCRFTLFSINRHEPKSYSTSRNPFNIHDVIHFFKTHRPQWLIQILVSLFIAMLAVFILSTLNT